jgi:hypothetical protein
MNKILASVYPCRLSHKRETGSVWITHQSARDRESDDEIGFRLKPMRAQLNWQAKNIVDRSHADPEIVEKRLQR